MLVFCHDPRIGWAVIRDTGTEYRILDYGNIKPDNLGREYTADKKIFSKHPLVLLKAESIFKEIFDKYEPDHYVTETAFAQARFINAFASLNRWLTNLSVFLYRDYKKILFGLAPKQVKAIFASDGTSGKLDMKAALLQRRDITWIKAFDEVEVTEHVVDAIGVGIAFCIFHNKRGEAKKV